MSDSDRPKPSMKRPSLRELAERVSKTPPPPAVQTPLPISRVAPAARESAPPSSFGPASIASAPSSMSAPPSLSLAARAAAVSNAPAGVAAPVAAPASVAPASVAPSSVAAPSQPAPSNVVPLKREPEQKKGGSYIGLIIAAAGIAAAAGLFFFLQPKSTNTTSTNNKTVVADDDKKPASEGAADAKPEPVKNGGEVTPDAPKDDGALDLADLTKPDTAPVEPAPGTPPTANTDPNSKAPRPEKVAMDGTLEDKMKETVGPIEKKDEAEPASGQEKGPKNVPDQPPQGSVTSAVNKVMGGAKACVAGADDVSRATITFSSGGTVQSVTVGGWASGKGSVVSCIKAALSGATVGPFSKPTYSFSVTIRP